MPQFYAGQPYPGEPGRLLHAHIAAKRALTDHIEAYPAQPQLRRLEVRWQPTDPGMAA